MKMPNISINRLETMHFSPVKSNRSWRSSLTESDYSKSKLEPLANFTVVYCFKLLYNIMLFSLYTVMVFSDHTACLTKSGKNITERFQTCFLLGLGILSIDFANSQVLLYYFKSKVQAEVDKCGVASQIASSNLKCTEKIEKVLRFFRIIVCYVQFMNVHSKIGDYCVNTLGVLHLEGSWLNALVILQLYKVVVFTAWDILVAYVEGLSYQSDFLSETERSYDEEEEQTFLKKPPASAYHEAYSRYAR